MESPTDPEDINLDEKTEFIIDIKHELIDPDVSIKAKYVSTNLEKVENNGESLERSGCIKSEEVNLTHEDKKDSLILFGPENLKEETKFARHVKRSKVAKSNAARKKANSEVSVEGDKGTDKTRKCRFCDYSTIHLGYFNRHLQRHKTIDDFQCTQCSYQSPIKGSLIKHILCHKDADQVATYKCNDCDYRSRHLNNLQKHMKRHKKLAELTVYKCRECDYQSIRSYDLKRHHATRHTSGAGHASSGLTAQFLLAGKDKEKEENNGESLDSTGCIKSKEVDLNSVDKKDSLMNFDPEKLEEATEFAGHVKGAKVAEKDVAHERKENVLETPHSVAPAEGDKGAGVYKTRKCAHCDYSTIRLDLLKRHLERHKTIQDFQCAQCSYRTGSKDNLIKHIFRHKDADQVAIYKCTHCDHKSRRLSSLKQHLKRHKTIDELPAYKCQSCGYQTFRSYDLKRHEARHTSGGGHTSGALLTAWILESKDMEKKENNGESLDNSGFIRFEEADLKSEDEKESLFDPENPAEEAKFARHVKSIKVVKKDDTLERKEKVRKAAYTEASVKVDKVAGIIKIRTCGFCDYSTRYLGNIKMHLRRHETSEDFKCTQCSYQTFSKDNLNRHIFRHKDGDQVATYKCTECAYKTGLLTDFKQHLNRHKIINELSVYKCYACGYQTIHSHDLKRHHLSRHTSSADHTSGSLFTAQVLLEGKDNMEKEENNGESLDSTGCIKSEEVDLKSEDEKDSSINFDPGKLEEETKFARHIKMVKVAKRDVAHKTKENVLETSYSEAPAEGDKGAGAFETRKCSRCDYSTIRWDLLKRHLERHKNIQNFQCDQCSYQTGTKKNLIKHILYHKDADQVATYKCTECDYNTSGLINWKQHLKRHKKANELPVYKCRDCGYQTFRSYDLKRHYLTRHGSGAGYSRGSLLQFLLEGKDRDKEENNKESLDSFDKVDLKNEDKNNSLTHFGPENPEEETKFARHVKRIRDAKRDAALKRKKNVRKAPYTEASVKMDNGAGRAKIRTCNYCDYSSIYLNHIKRHLRQHNITIQDFKCTQCSYQTFSKNNLNRHIFRHKDGDQVATYKCTDCDYNAGLLIDFKQHLKWHKIINELPVYKCRECDYQTIRLNDLKPHHLSRHTSGALLTDQFSLEGKDMIKEENNGQSLDSTGCIKSEEVDLKSEDETDSKDMEKKENNGESLDSSGCIRFKEVDLKNEDKKDSLITFCPEKLEETLEGDKGADRYKTHKCAHCDYSTKRMDHLKRHLKRHETIQDFQCAQCSYQTSRKYNLIRHVFSHKNAVQVAPYKCTDCDYKTRRLGNFKQHSMLHKAANELTMYKCRECDYQTIRAFALKQHHLTCHRSGAGQTSGSLLTAQYLSEGKDTEKGEHNGESLDSSKEKKEDKLDSFITLSPEKLEEKTMEEDEGADSVKIHECAHCDYSTKRLNHLKRHLQRHKTTRDFQCAQCSYQTWCRENLIKHVSRHKNRDQVATHRCTDCDYKTRRLDHMKRHLKRHKTVDELTVYKCRECDFQTIRSSALTRHHLARHRSGDGHKSGTLLAAQFLSEGKDMEKGDDNGEILDSSGCIRFEEIDLKSEDEKDSKDMEKEESNRKSLDSSGCIKFEEIDLKSEDEKDSKDMEKEESNRKSLDSSGCIKFEEIDLKSEDEKDSSINFGAEKLEQKFANVFRHRNADQVPTYKCTNCGFQTMRSDSLMKHLMRHNTVDELIMYNCHECDYETFSIQDLKRHTRDTGHTTVTGHTSGAGNASGAGHTSGAAHMRNTKPKKHKCVECNYATDRLHCFKRYLARHASGADCVIPKKHKCSKCNYERDQLYSLKRHVKVRHKGGYKKDGVM